MCTLATTVMYSMNSFNYLINWYQWYLNGYTNNYFICVDNLITDRDNFACANALKLYKNGDTKPLEQVMQY